jgi:bifunctional UDP-N-acetylglucosamine pyrophosphorylase/glucosamine-1-phosphate N-acetyltransferase
MDAIILAAGKGTRLRPHTNITPKPLLPVQGRPILDWIIGALPPVDRLMVVVNYLAEEIEAYLKTQTHIRNWTTVRQNIPRGTGDAFLSCKTMGTSDRVMVLNGDDLIGRADLLALSRVPMGVLTHEVQNPRAFGICFPRADGTLEKIVEKPDLDGPALANIGGYLFPKKAFDIPLELSPRGEYEITDIIAALAKESAFHVVKANYWLPIGDIPQWEASQTADVSPVA